MIQPHGVDDDVALVAIVVVVVDEVVVLVVRGVVVVVVGAVVVVVGARVVVVVGLLVVVVVVGALVVVVVEGVDVVGWAAAGGSVTAPKLSSAELAAPATKSPMRRRRPTDMAEA